MLALSFGRRLPFAWHKKTGLANVKVKKLARERTIEKSILLGGPDTDLEGQFGIAGKNAGLPTIKMGPEGFTQGLIQRNQGFLLAKPLPIRRINHHQAPGTQWPGLGQVAKTNRDVILKTGPGQVATGIGHRSPVKIVTPDLRNQRKSLFSAALSLYTEIGPKIRPVASPTHKTKPQAAKPGRPI